MAHARHSCRAPRHIPAASSFFPGGGVAHTPHEIMKTRQYLISAFAAVLSLVFGQGCEKKSDSGASNSGGASSSAKTLKFSAIPDQDKKNLEKFNSIAGHLSKEL